MVYESDFYTIRRPYSRPNITSYSVTWDSNLAPGVGKILWVSPLSGRVYSTGQSFHHAIPNVAHRRLTPVSSPVSSAARMRPSVLIAELDRIHHKVRPSLGHMAGEDFLNDHSIVSFDDETRSIRAQTNALLKRIHTPLPRASKPLPIINSTYQYEEQPLQPRITSDEYIRRMLREVRDVRRDVQTMSQYPEPAKQYIGKGHLACISYAAGRPVSRRRKLFYDDDQVRNEVNVLSRYDRMRQAASSPQLPELNGDAGPAALYCAPQPRQERAVTSRFYKPSQPVRDPGVKRVSAAAVEAVERQTAAELKARAAQQTQQQLESVEAAVEVEAEERERERKKQAEREAEERELAEMARRAAQAEAEAAAAARQLEEEKAAARRLEEEAKLEAERKAEEEARLEAERKAEEEARLEAERKAEEQAKLETERKAEEERLEVERKAEEARLEAERLEKERAEAERKAEEERQAAEAEAAAAAAAAEAEAAAAAAAAAAAEEEAAAEVAAVSETEPEADAPSAEPEPAAEPAEAPAETAEPATETAEPEPEGPEPVVEEPASPEAPAPSHEPAASIEEVGSGEEDE